MREETEGNPFKELLAFAGRVGRRGGRRGRAGARRRLGHFFGVMVVLVVMHSAFFGGVLCTFVVVCAMLMFMVHGV